MNRITSTLFGFALLWAVAVLSNVPLFSQAFYGSVVGTITDQSGAALRGATVTLTNSGTGESHQTQSGMEATISS